MSSKSVFQVLLSIGVLIIWGLVIKRIYNNTSDNIEALPIATALFRSQTKKDAENYKLSLNYPDPFLKSEASRNVKPTQGTEGRSKTPTSPKKIVPTPQQPQSFVWPEIKFKGTIENKKEGKIIGLINYKGVDQIISIQDVIEGCRIKEISSTQFSLVNKEGEVKCYLK